MYSEKQAFDIVRKAFPTSEIKKPIEYRHVWLFQVFSDDPDEGDMDPYFSVDTLTGELRDFSIITDGNIEEITKKFLELDN